MMFSKVLNYPAASGTANAHTRFMGTSTAVVPSTASTSSSTFNYDNLRLDDILCAVCQSVLNEPVFLPCQHLFCRNCIRGTIESNKLYCPCCRKRFGTWYRNASRANELVHEQLWRAIQSQFREHLDEDNPAGGSSKHQAKPLYTAPPTSTVQLANPGEIGKEYKDELKRYQKEIFEEKAKELTASEQYIINLYKQEGIIDLADNSSHVSVSSATTPDLHDGGGGVGGEKCSTDAHASTSSGAVAGPSSSTARTHPVSNQLPIQNGIKASGSFNHTSPSSGSVISISSTSIASDLTASSCATSSASGRYSLIKSVAQKVGRSAEIVKQKVQDTILHRLTAGKLQQHQRSLNAIDLNKSELCVKPTAVHRQERRGVEGEDAEGDDTDSLKSEQNHFIPIVQSMPKSSFSCNTFRRVPTVRPVPSPVKYESSPKKSPYQPLNKHNRWPSAFKVVNLSLLSPPPIPILEPGEQSSPSVAAVASSKKKESPPKVARRPRGRPRRITFSPAKRQKTPPKQTPKCDDNAGPSGTSDRTKREVRPSTIKDIIVSDQQRREQQIEMERRDFEFAQKLQQKLNRASGVMQEIQRQSGAVPRSTGYSLRRRGSSNNSFASGNDNSIVLNHTNDNTPSSSGSTMKKPTTQATRKRKATSSSVENDVPSSSSPPKRVAPQMKTRRQTRQWRQKIENDSSLGDAMEDGPPEVASLAAATPVRKSTRNKTR